MPGKYSFEGLDIKSRGHTAVGNKTVKIFSPVMARIVKRKVSSIAKVVIRCLCDSCNHTCKHL